MPTVPELTEDTSLSSWPSSSCCSTEMKCSKLLLLDPHQHQCNSAVALLYPSR